MSILRVFKSLKVGKLEFLSSIASLCSNDRYSIVITGVVKQFFLFARNYISIKIGERHLLEGFFLITVEKIWIGS